MGPQLEDLIQKQEGVRLLRVDIVKWGSPVAKQYKIGMLPQVWLYDGEDVVTHDTGQALKELGFQ